MKCPVCGYIFKSGNVCPDCGTDIVLYNKTRTISDRLYNSGLKCANERDLTGAVENLKKSLMVNKFNTKARNLLGLVYFEKGLVADALREWVMSSNFDKNDKTAGEYLEKLQKNARELEKMNDALRLYNLAIQYMGQHSEDLALIQLKKAIDYNPKLVDAYNLAALCNMASGNNTAAEPFVKRVLYLDKKNPTALRYMREITPVSKVSSKGADDDFRSDEDVKSRRKRRMSYKETNRGIIGKQEVISFAGGVVCAAAVLFALVFPTMLESRSKTINDLKTTLENYESYNGGDGTASYDDILKENASLKEEVDKYKESVTLQTKIGNINKAYAMLANNEYKEAALLVKDIDISDLSDEDIALYDQVREQTFAKAAEDLYSEGKMYYLSGKYEDAETALNDCLDLITDESYEGEVIYYLGKIAEAKGENATAISYFERVVNDYPNSSQVVNAQNSLNTLNASVNSQNTDDGGNTESSANNTAN